jgi:hypothetical protein
VTYIADDEIVIVNDEIVAKYRDVRFNEKDLEYIVVGCWPMSMSLIRVSIYDNVLMDGPGHDIRLDNLCAGIDDSCSGFTAQNAKCSFRK